MNYFIARDGQQYGPYTLGDLQRYVASGDVSIADLATSDGLPEPMPVGQIIGTIAAPPPAYHSSASVTFAPEFANAPNLHWTLVMLFTIMSCGLFLAVWEIVQASWIRGLEPKSRSIFFYGANVVMLLVLAGIGANAGMTHTQTGSPTTLIQFLCWAITLAGRFTFKSTMEEHYNGAEPMGLSLSGVMVFFFGGIYFQYHINDINRRKAADRLYALTR